MAEFVQDQAENISSILKIENNAPNTVIEPESIDATVETNMDPAMATSKVVASSIDPSVESSVDPVEESSANVESSIDPVIESNMDPEIECSMDPMIEIEQEISIPRPVLSPEEIQQAKLCQVCKTADWKYTCPRCLTHTCSLTCAKHHKFEATCSGIRDKTSYVPLRQYNESNMMSDYTYLEDVSRQSDNLTRSRMDTTKDLQGKAAENRAKMFCKSAIQMGIKFSSLPVGMSRHKLNQSNYSKNLKQIFWSMEVNFCRGDKKERYLEHSFPSSKPFHAFFDNLLFSESPIGKGSYGITRHQIKDFIDAGMDQFIVALKKEKAPRGHFINVTHVLDLCFKDVLKNETVIEYPIFYIWLKSDGMPKDVITLEDKKQMIAEVPVKPAEEAQEAQEQQEAPAEELITAEREQDDDIQFIL